MLHENVVRVKKSKSMFFKINTKFVKLYKKKKKQNSANIFWYSTQTRDPTNEKLS